MADLRGESIRLSFGVSSGEYIVDDARTGLRIGPACPFVNVKGQWNNEVELDFSTETAADIDISRTRNSLSAKLHSKSMPAFHMKFHISNNFLIVESSATNNLDSSLLYSSMGPLKSLNTNGLKWAETASAKTERVRVYRPGYQSWTPAGSLPATTSYALPPLDFFVKTAFGPLMKRPKDNRQHLIDSFTIIGSGNKFMLIGFLSAKKFFPQVEASFYSRGVRMAGLRAKCAGGWMRMAPGETVELEKMVIGFSDDPHELIEGYFELAGKENNARIPDETPTGWCSWYRYFTAISRQLAGKNLDSLETMRDRIKLEYFQLDDGWQERIGDWTWNHKFRNGPREMALRIKQAGYKPGLWLAPFIAARGSKTYREHKDWFIKDRKGKPVLAGINPIWKGRLYYALDATNKDFLDYLGDLFKRIVNDWGFEYVKLDFMFAALMGENRSAPNTTGVEAYRMGLSKIREAVGEDTLILGCGAPILPSVGLVDFMRIGADVAPYWDKAYQTAITRSPIGPSAKDSIRNILTRSGMHGRLWANDPDCLLVREDHSSLTPEEVQSLVTAIGLSAGGVLISDDMSVLSDERISWAAMTLPPYERSAKPLDLFEKAMPEIYFLKGEQGSGRHVLALFNWESKGRSKTIDLNRLGLAGPHHAFDFWKENYIGVVTNSSNTVSVPGHGVSLLSLVEAKEGPALLASTLHITAGLKELTSCKIDRKSLKIDIELSGEREGAIFLYILPCELKEKINRMESCIWVTDKVVKMPLKFKDRITINV